MTMVLLITDPLPALKTTSPSLVGGECYFILPRVAGAG